MVKGLTLFAFSPLGRPACLELAGLHDQTLVEPGQALMWSSAQVVIGTAMVWLANAAHPPIRVKRRMKIA